MKDDTRSWLLHQGKGFLCIIALSLLLAISVNAVRKDDIPWMERRREVKPGGLLPYFPVYPSSNSSPQKYLGLPLGQGVVPLTEAKADLLILEVLNVYCFTCQNQALAFNHVFQSIERRPDLKGRIKIVGMAVGNTEEEADDFRKEYGLRFPVFADIDGRAPQFLGPHMPPPFSIYVGRDGSGKLGLVTATHEGVFEDQKMLLDKLLQLLKMEPGAKWRGPLFEAEE